jgi:UDP-glucose 4-epimerase
VKVVVTGAAGFLGSHLCERLSADGHLVTGLDDLSVGTVGHLATARRAKGFAFHHLDVAAPLVRDALARERPDVVVHLATALPIEVLAGAAELGARVVLGSGASLYGGPKRGVTERHGPHPATVAGARHAAAEAYAHAYVQQGLSCATLRFTTLYGPRSRGVATTWVGRLLAGKPTTLRGDGTAVRDLLYVEDAVDAVLRCLGGKADGRRLNIATGEGTSLRALHTMAAQAAGAPDAPDFAPADPDELATLLADPGAARRTLGWEASIGLKEGLARLADTLRKR